SASPRHDARVVSGREAVEPELHHATQHQVEPHEGVAADAWIRRPALEISAVKRLDDALTELTLQVPAVIRNADQRSDAASVLDSRQRAAAPVSGALLHVVTRPLLER